MTYNHKFYLFCDPILFNYTINCKGTFLPKKIESVYTIKQNKEEGLEVFDFFTLTLTLIPIKIVFFLFKEIRKIN